MTIILSPRRGVEHHLFHVGGTSAIFFWTSSMLFLKKLGWETGVFLLLTTHHATEQQWPHLQIAPTISAIVLTCSYTNRKCFLSLQMGSYE